jgi:hypothetical protein
MLGSPCKARGLIVVGTDEIINNQGMVSVVPRPPSHDKGFLHPQERLRGLEAG